MLPELVFDSGGLPMWQEEAVVGDGGWDEFVIEICQNLSFRLFPLNERTCYVYCYTL